MINLKQVFTKAPYSRIKEVERIMNMYASKFGIITKEDYAAFYATLLAEVGTNATIKEENMNYSASSLKKVFSSFRNNPALADKYGRSKNHPANKEMIANIAYANRIGNGNVSSNDGWNYRGRGFIQLTGRSNYKKAAETIKEVIGVDFMFEQFPDIVGTDTGAIISALAFWKMNNLHGKSIDQVTDAVNKYTDSRFKRKQYYNMLLNLM